MSTFKITDKFALESRRLFILAGSIVEREVGCGMRADIELPSDFSISTRVHSVEFALRADKREDVCLCFRYETNAELEMWRALDLDGKVIELADFEVESADRTAEAAVRSASEP